MLACSRGPYSSDSPTTLFLNRWASLCENVLVRKNQIYFTIFEKSQLLALICERVETTHLTARSAIRGQHNTCPKQVVSMAHGVTRMFTDCFVCSCSRFSHCRKFVDAAVGDAFAGLTSEELASSLLDAGIAFGALNKVRTPACCDTFSVGHLFAYHRSVI